MKRTVQIISGPLEGYSFSIGHGKPVKVGRGHSNDIIVGHDPCMSTKHAILRVDHQQLEVSDQNSSNGTFVDGQKLSPGAFFPVNDFVVLGSTLMTILKTSEENNLAPIPVDSAKVNTWLENPVFASAVEDARRHGDPFVGIPNLFVGLHSHHQALVDAFLSAIGKTYAQVVKRWRDLEFFDLPLKWINDFIKFQITSQPPGTFLVTPRVQGIFEILELMGGFDPDRFFKLLLDEDYNLMFPLLDWRETKNTWFKEGKETSQSSSEARQTGPLDVHRELLLPDQIWSDVNSSLTRSGFVVLQGSKGCGKTSVMHRLFHPMTQFSFPRQYAEDPILYDSRVFVIFNQPEHLRVYVNAIMRSLGRDGVVGIDHFDHLLETLQETYLDRGPLIQAIRNRRANLILSIETDDVQMIKDLFRDMVIMDLDHYVAQVSHDIHNALIKRFEHRVRCLVGADAREFFMEFIVKPAPHNIDALENFLQLCAARSYGIDFPFKELAEETRAMGLLGKTFFRDIYDEWVGKTKVTTSKQQVVSPKHQPDQSQLDEQMLNLLLQLETLVQTFVKNEFKVSLHYSDQTRSLTEERMLSQSQKIEELKSQMVVLLTAYQSSFRNWFNAFWERLDPEHLKATPGVGNNAKKLWSEYATRANLIDSAYAEDHFHEIAARVFMDMWKKQRASN